MYRAPPERLHGRPCTAAACRHGAAHAPPAYSNKATDAVLPRRPRRPKADADIMIFFSRHDAFGISALGLPASHAPSSQPFAEVGNAGRSMHSLLFHGRIERHDVG